MIQFPFKLSGITTCVPQCTFSEEKIFIQGKDIKGIKNVSVNTLNPTNDVDLYPFKLNINSGSEQVVEGTDFSGIREGLVNEDF